MKYARENLKCKIFLIVCLPAYSDWAVELIKINENVGKYWGENDLLFSSGKIRSPAEFFFVY